jgi:hypothetical protein
MVQKDSIWSKIIRGLSALEGTKGAMKWYVNTWRKHKPWKIGNCPSWKLDVSLLP